MPSAVQNLVIHQIYRGTVRNPLAEGLHVGDRLAVQGVVIEVLEDGVVIQEPDEANKSAQRLKQKRGIFVYTGGSHKGQLKPGNVISVEGTVQISHGEPHAPPKEGERPYRSSPYAIPRVQLLATGHNGAWNVLGNAPLPRPIEIDSDIYVDPNDQVAARNALFLMSDQRVSVPNPLVTQGTERDEFVGTDGFYVVPNAGMGVPGLVDNGAVVLSEKVVGASPLQIYFGASRAQGGSASVQARLGDTVQSLTADGQVKNEVAGVLRLQGDADFILSADPSADISISSRSLEPEPTTLVGDRHHLTVSTMNCYNFDPGDDPSKLAKQVVDYMRSPDVIGLQEIQDNDGPIDSNVLAGDETGAALIAAIRARAEERGEAPPNYAYYEVAPKGPEGGQPGGHIRVGYLVNLDRVQVVGGPQRLFEDQPGKRGPFARVRKPLALTVRFNGHDVHLRNIHLSAKVGSSPIKGTLAARGALPAINSGDKNRQRQARAVRQEVGQLFRENPTAHAVILGDANAAAFEGSTQLLAGSTLSLMTEGKDLYSHLFGGTGMQLDQIAVSPHLADDLELEVVKINAGFEEEIRASDHNPVVIRLKLGEGQEFEPKPINPDPAILEEFSKYLQGATPRDIAKLKAVVRDGVLPEGWGELTQVRHVTAVHAIRTKGREVAKARHQEFAWKPTPADAVELAQAVEATKSLQPGEEVQRTIYNLDFGDGESTAPTELYQDVVKQVDDLPTGSAIYGSIYGFEGVPELLVALEEAKARGVKIRLTTDINSDGTFTYRDTETFLRRLGPDCIRVENVGTSSILHNKFLAFYKAKPGADPMKDGDDAFESATTMLSTGNVSTAGIQGGFNSNRAVLWTSKNIAALIRAEALQMWNGAFHKRKQALVETKLSPMNVVGADGKPVTNIGFELYFSPQNKAIDHGIVPRLKRVKKFRGQLFHLSHPRVVEALLLAHQQNDADIFILHDANGAGNAYTREALETLRSAPPNASGKRIRVMIETSAGKEHMKSGGGETVDGEVFQIDGSLNWTNSAQDSNDEFASIVTGDKDLVEGFYQDTEQKISKLPVLAQYWFIASEGLLSRGSLIDKRDNDHDGKTDPLARARNVRFERWAIERAVQDMMDAVERGWEDRDPLAAMVEAMGYLESEIKRNYRAYQTEAKLLEHRLENDSLPSADRIAAENRLTQLQVSLQDLDAGDGKRGALIDIRAWLANPQLPELRESKAA